MQQKSLVFYWSMDHMFIWIFLSHLSVKKKQMYLYEYFLSMQINGWDGLQKRKALYRALETLFN